MHVIHTLYVHNARVNNDFFSKGIRIFFFSDFVRFLRTRLVRCGYARWLARILYYYVPASYCSRYDIIILYYVGTSKTLSLFRVRCVHYKNIIYIIHTHTHDIYIHRYIVLAGAFDETAVQRYDAAESARVRGFGLVFLVRYISDLEPTKTIHIQCVIYSITHTHIE